MSIYHVLVPWNVVERNLVKPRLVSLSFKSTLGTAQLAPFPSHTSGITILRISPQNMIRCKSWPTEGYYWNKLVMNSVGRADDFPHVYSLNSLRTRSIVVIPSC